MRIVFRLASPRLAVFARAAPEIVLCLRGLLSLLILLYLFPGLTSPKSWKISIILADSSQTLKFFVAFLKVELYYIAFLHRCGLFSDSLALGLRSLPVRLQKSFSASAAFFLSSSSLILSSLAAFSAAVTDPVLGRRRPLGEGILLAASLASLGRSFL